jgi:hypothetical protein
MSRLARWYIRIDQARLVPQSDIEMRAEFEIDSCSLSRNYKRGWRIR